MRALAAAASDQLWIEKVRLATSADEATAAAPGETDDVAHLLDEGITDQGLNGVLVEDFGQLFGRIPPDLGEESEVLADARAGRFGGLLRDAAASLRARLGQGLDG